MLSTVARRCPLHHRSKRLLTDINLCTLTPRRQSTRSGFVATSTSNSNRTRHVYLPGQRRRWNSSFSTSAPKRDALDETGTGERGFSAALLFRPNSLSVEDAWAVIDRAKDVWPSLQTHDDTWSSDWAQWEDLFPLYWHSPHYLMIPNIEMFVNLQYGIQGETKPLFYSLPVSQEDWLNMKKGMGETGQPLPATPPDWFYFTIVGKEDSEVYMAEMQSQTIARLYLGDKPLGVDGLLDVLGPPDRRNALVLETLSPSEEGCQLLERIFARDPTVTGVLGEERWLGTVPEPTETWQEWLAQPEALSEDVENDEIEEFDEEGMENEELVEEDEEADKVGVEASEEIQLSGEEQAVLEDARQLGLTEDMDKLSEMMQEAEGEIDRTVKRLGEVLAEAADPSSFSTSTSPAEDQSSLAADPLSTDPDAVDRAVEHILNSDSSTLNLSQLRGLSVEQLAEVQGRLEAIAADVEERKEAGASAWKSEGDGEMETSRVDDDRMRVRVPLKPSKGEGPKPGDS